ncbi:MAG TPA: hypothetical protein EYP86_03995 [Candidatus Altiarchaeales archaeon]|nr:hypothetical protein [Candidatus Altiarchaeales archaeon]
MFRKILIFIWILTLIMLVDAQTNPYITLEWKYKAREAINDIHVADVDNDGKKEIVAGSYDNHVHLIGYNGSKIWKYNARCPVYSVSAADVDRDSYKEILSGSCRPVHILSYDKGVEAKFLTNDQVKKIITGDFDSDGKEDVMAVSGWERNSVVYIFNNNSEILWQNSFRGGFPWGLAMADLDNDNEKEVIIGSTSVMVYGRDKKLKWRYDTENFVYDLIVDDIDNDNKKEIIVGTHLMIYVIDYEGNLKWKYETPTTVKSIYAVDLDNDGKKEVIAGSDKVYLFDNGGNLLWDFQTNGSVNTVTAGDMDWDGIKEIAVGSEHLYVLDKDGNLQLEYIPYRDIIDVWISDLDGDGKNELIAGGQDYTVYCFKSREIYVNQQRFYEFYGSGKSLYRQNDYENARIELEKAIEISKLTTTGLSQDDIDDCNSMLENINKILRPETTTSTTIRETTIVQETTTSTIEAPQGGQELPLIPIISVVLTIVIIAYLVLKRKS